MSAILLGIESHLRIRGGLRKWFVPITVVLFVVFATEIYLSARLESQTYDEPAHLYAGYSYWLKSDFGVNPEHPPLVKLVAALPLLVDEPPYPAPINASYISFRSQSALDGMMMMSAPNAQSILAHARIAVSVFAFVLGVLVVLAAREMFGEVAALVALLLFVCDPLIVAHAPLIGTDLGAACMIFAAVYAFYRYCKKPSYLRLGLCCLTAGLSLAAKHSAILLFPILAMLILGELLVVRNSAFTSELAIPPFREWLRAMGIFSAIFVSAIAILWAFYGFRYAARPGGQQINPPTNVYIQTLHRPLERELIGFATRHHLVPESYLFGFTDVTLLTRSGRAMFLLGKQFAVGRWFYFPIAFLIKSTIGFLLLLSLLPFARALRQIRFRREAITLILPAVVFFGAAMSSKLNIGVRHILPIMPFLIVLAAGGAVLLARQSQRWAWAAGVLVALHAASSLHAFPNYLPYSNEVFGGPNQTWRVLGDSNVGWGGGLKALRADLASRNITQCWLAYSALPNPADFQIPCKRLPTFYSALADQGQQKPVPEHIDGPVYISSEELNGNLWGPISMNPYQNFWGLQPSQVIAGEILEFDGGFDIPRVSALSESVVAIWLMRQGKLDEAIAQAQHAIEVDPSSIYAHQMLYLIYAAAHKSDDAEREYETEHKEYRPLSDEEKKFFFAPPIDQPAKE